MIEFVYIFLVKLSLQLLKMIIPFYDFLEKTFSSCSKLFCNKEIADQTNIGSAEKDIGTIKILQLKSARDLKCEICGKYFTKKGLKIHSGRMHK